MVDNQSEQSKAGRPRIQSGTTQGLTVDDGSAHGGRALDPQRYN